MTSGISTSRDINVLLPRSPRHEDRGSRLLEEHGVVFASTVGHQSKPNLVLSVPFHILKALVCCETCSQQPRRAIGQGAITTAVVCIKTPFVGLTRIGSFCKTYPFCSTGQVEARGTEQDRASVRCKCSIPDLGPFRLHLSSTHPCRANICKGEAEALW